MSPEEATSFKYIEEEGGFRWPFKPNYDALKGITPEAWEDASREFLDFLNNGGEICLCFDLLMYKIQGKYATTPDLIRHENIINRENLPYELVRDVRDCFEGGNGEYLFDKKNAVNRVFETEEAASEFLRQFLGLGYETRVVDLWDDESVVRKKDGVRI